MTRNVTIVVLALASLVQRVQAAPSETPLGTAFTYQGKLANNGSGVNGDVDMRFSLWDAATSGHRVGPVLIFDGVIAAPVTVTNGLFNVALDFGSSSKIFTAGSSRWLAIEFRSPHDPSDKGAYTALTPRQPVDPTPFSLFSQNTRGLGVDGSGNVGIGTSAPTSPLHVVVGVPDDDGGQMKFENANPGSSYDTDAQLIGKNRFGTMQNMAWASFGARIGMRNVTNGGSGNVYFTSGNDSVFMVGAANGGVGIGTDLPEQMLSVYGGMNIDQANANSSGLAGSPGLTFGSGSGEGIASNRNPGSNQYGLDFYTVWTSRLSITNPGNVGIGTRTPSGKLDVAGNLPVISDTIDQQQNLSNGLSPSNNMWQSFTAGRSGLLTAVSLYGKWPTSPDGSGILSIYEGEGTGGALLATQAVTICNCGGLPTFHSFFVSAPPLITAERKYTFRISVTGGLTMFSVAFQNGDFYPRGQANMGSSTDYRFHTRVTPATTGSLLTVQDGSGVGIGTVTPSNILSVEGSADFSGRIGIGTPDPTNELSVNGNADFSGRVGIGTPNPATKLDVQGDINATGSVFVSCGTLTCSDERFKTTIMPLDNALGLLDQLHPVTFDWRRDEFPDRHFAKGQQIGLVAQQVCEVLPEVVQRSGDGYLSIDYGRLTPLLIQAVKEEEEEQRTAVCAQNDAIQALRAKNDELRAKNDALQARLERLEDMVSALAKRDR